MSGEHSCAALERRAVGGHSISEARLKAPRTHVRFFEGEGGEISAVWVRAPKHPGLLSRLHRLLIEEHVQIEHANVRPVGDELAHQLSLADLDGGPVPAGRRDRLQHLVIAAVAQAALEVEAIGTGLPRVRSVEAG